MNYKLYEVEKSQKKSFKVCLNQHLRGQFKFYHSICVQFVTLLYVLTSLGKGWTNVHPDFQNGSKKLFHIDSE